MNTSLLTVGKDKQHCMYIPIKLGSQLQSWPLTSGGPPSYISEPGDDVEKMSYSPPAKSSAAKADEKWTGIRLAPSRTMGKSAKTWTMWRIAAREYREQSQWLLDTASTPTIRLSQKSVVAEQSQGPLDVVLYPVGPVTDSPMVTDVAPFAHTESQHAIMKSARQQSCGSPESGIDCDDCQFFPEESLLLEAQEPFCEVAANLEISRPDATIELTDSSSVDNETKSGLDVRISSATEVHGARDEHESEGYVVASETLPETARTRKPQTELRGAELIGIGPCSPNSNMEPHSDDTTAMDKTVLSSNSTCSRTQEVKHTLTRRRKTTAALADHIFLENTAQNADDERAWHKVLERCRRGSMKTAFRSLKEAIPDLSTLEKVAKVSILNHARDYCVYLQNTEELLLLEKSRLIEQRNRRVKKLDDAGIIIWDSVYLSPSNVGPPSLQPGTEKTDLSQSPTPNAGVYLSPSNGEPPSLQPGAKKTEMSQSPSLNASMYLSPWNGGPPSLQPGAEKTDMSQSPTPNASLGPSSTHSLPLDVSLADHSYFSPPPGMNFWDQRKGLSAFDMLKLKIAETNQIFSEDEEIDVTTIDETFCTKDFLLQDSTCSEESSETYDVADDFQIISVHSLAAQEPAKEKPFSGKGPDRPLPRCSRLYVRNINATNHGLKRVLMVEADYSIAEAIPPTLLNAPPNKKAHFDTDSQQSAARSARRHLPKRAFNYRKKQFPGRNATNKRSPCSVKGMRGTDCNKLSPKKATFENCAVTPHTTELIKPQHKHLAKKQLSDIDAVHELKSPYGSDVEFSVGKNCTRRNSCSVGGASTTEEEGIEEVDCQPPFPIFDKEQCENISHGENQLDCAQDEESATEDDADGESGIEEVDCQPICPYAETEVTENVDYDEMQLQYSGCGGTHDEERARSKRGTENVHCQQPQCQLSDTGAIVGSNDGKRLIATKSVIPDGTATFEVSPTAEILSNPIGSKLVEDSHTSVSQRRQTVTPTVNEESPNFEPLTTNNLEGCDLNPHTTPVANEMVSEGRYLDQCDSELGFGSENPRNEISSVDCGSRSVDRHCNRQENGDDTFEHGDKKEMYAKDSAAKCDTGSKFIDYLGNEETDMNSESDDSIENMFEDNEVFLAPENFEDQESSSDIESNGRFADVNDWGKEVERIEYNMLPTVSLERIDVQPSSTRPVLRSNVEKSGTLDSLPRVIRTCVSKPTTLPKVDQCNSNASPQLDRISELRKKLRQKEADLEKIRKNIVSLDDIPMG